MSKVYIKLTKVLDITRSTQVDRVIITDACIRSFALPTLDSEPYVGNVIRLVYNHIAYTKVAITTGCSSIGNLINEGGLVADILYNYKAIHTEIIKQYNNFISSIKFVKIDDGIVEFDVNY